MLKSRALSDRLFNSQLAIGLRHNLRDWGFRPYLPLWLLSHCKCMLCPLSGAHEEVHFTAHVDNFLRIRDRFWTICLAR